MNLRTIVGVLALAALAAGCSTPDNGPATSSAPATAPSAQSLPYGGAPKVENPLPDTVFSDGPCQALTPDQLTFQLGSAVPGKPDNSAVPSCDWISPDTHARIGLSFFGKDNDGLSNVYANVRPQMKRFDVLPPIQGFPAVAYSTQPGPITNSCDVNVGVTDRLSFMVEAAPGETKLNKIDPCPLAVSVAGNVITTLKQKAGR
ncbi:DUF3558 domain-containing protein [Amycolatopsis echigonensis]|uniref:DUF3558 domain-containing protein n=1 Tax=Amycolatopsis echigonensis TaxID=2576905 RepID=A0A8E2B2L6_9PSEU|nr:DUF3558 domain-containing protein [Amycolatopsis echigonensis]MBB2499502.1 DUF3558 domain-containing protein [Amycolatopsis echigonensis]